MLKIIHRPAYPSTTDRHHVSYCSKVSKFCQEGFFKHALTENADQLQRFIIDNNVRLFQFLHHLKKLFSFTHGKIQL